MTNFKLASAVALAGATLALFVTMIPMGGALRAGLAPWPGVGAVVMATAAFLVSRDQRSFLVAGLLAAAGIVGLAYGLTVTEFLTVIVFPGPIIGVVIALLVFGLGAAKGIETARAGGGDTRSR
jgi:hypothetical protein